MPSAIKTNLLKRHLKAAEASQNGEIFLNKNANVLFVNYPFARQLGYFKEKFEPRTYFQINQNLTFLEWQKIWEDLEAHGQITIDTVHLTAAGENLPVRLKARLLKTGKEKYLRAIIENEMADTGEDLRLARFCLDNVRDMIFWLNEDATFRYFNRTFSKSTGYPKEEIRRMTLLDFFPDYSMDDFKQVWDALKTGRELSSEQEITCRDGSTIPVESHINMVSFDGRDFTSTVLRDIRERNKQQRRIKRQLEEIRRLKRQLEEENILLKEEINLKEHIGNIISQSPHYKPILRQISQVAATDATVLITGETGTGKELIARAIYQLSHRSEKQWVKVNCAAISENLIESELFGHEKGAFTGAFKRKTGRFERADGGTILLDEIGELPAELQVKLLRVLQDGQFERVGSTETLQVDVRVIAVTNRDLEAEVSAGRFREDLFYRLNVFPIHNIPLRERKDDIPLLVRHFIEKHNRLLGRNIEEIPASVMQQLMAYEYPGNVRELENLIERAMILSPGKELVSHFQFKKIAGEKKDFASMEEMQQRHILNALIRAKGKISGRNSAAELLKMNGKTLYARMRKLGISKDDFLK